MLMEECLKLLTCKPLRLYLLNNRLQVFEGQMGMFGIPTFFVLLLISMWKVDCSFLIPNIVDQSYVTAVCRE